MGHLLEIIDPFLQVSIMALLKLLQHGVATNDARLQEITVKERRFTYDVHRDKMKYGFIILYVFKYSVKRRAPGLVNFVPAAAWHFCLALPAAITQSGDHLLAKSCGMGFGLGSSKCKKWSGVRYSLKPLWSS